MFLWHAVHKAKLQIQQRSLQKIVSGCTISCGSAIKEEEIVLCAKSGLRLRSAITVHSKISEARKDEYCVFSKMWNLKKKSIIQTLDISLMQCGSHLRRGKRAVSGCSGE